VNRKIMGLDLSLTSTGWSCDGEYGVISSKNKKTQRLVDISGEILEKCSKHKVETVVIEGYSFASRSGQAFSIGELGGVVRFCLLQSGFEFVEVPPTVRAKFATGRGNAAKSEVVSAISAKTGIVWTGSGADDMCDAWILEEIGLVHYGQQRFDWPKLNMSALESLDWTPTTR
jgi:crossover junction endodeoxyribonuclease RuvC